MRKPDYRILLVDDNITYGKTQREKAFDDYSTDLFPFEDWESAYVSLRAKPDFYQALILDAKGKITADDSSESMTHIISALGDIKELEGKGYIIPHVINTGYLDDSVVQSIKGVKIFSKGNEDKMYDYIIEQIDILPETRLRKKYQNVLSAFGSDRLPLNLEKKFLDIISFAESPSWSKAPDDFQSCKEDP